MENKLSTLFPRFIKDINRLQPEFSSGDRIWRIPMRFGSRPKDWTTVHITRYQDTYYCYWTEWNLSVEVSVRGKVLKPAYWPFNIKDSDKFVYMLKRFTRFAEQICRDWLAVYRQTLKELPLDMRFGTVPKGVVWRYYPDWYRVDTDLGKTKTTRFIQDVQAGKFRSDYSGHHDEMNLDLFMKYCKIAYTANFRRFRESIKKDMSGLEMYTQLADGRHEGLLELPPELSEAFDHWYHSKQGGGHPWEIYRGGNTTHIDLGVMKKAKGWSVFLSGSSLSRMAETIRIALALVKAGLPVEIHDAEELSSRLLGMDNLGIIPRFVINHRAAHNFEKEDRVFDCAHLHDFYRWNRLLPFISWKPLDPLRPRVV